MKEKTSKVTRKELYLEWDRNRVKFIACFPKQSCNIQCTQLLWRYKNLRKLDLAYKTLWEQLSLIESCSIRLVQRLHCSIVTKYYILIVRFDRECICLGCIKSLRVIKHGSQFCKLLCYMYASTQPSAHYDRHEPVHDLIASYMLFS